MCYAVLTMAASKPSKPPIVSTLNPNAPVFVPAAHLAAEDFSPEWWRLIHTSTSFREWWMKERFQSEEIEQPSYSDEIDELLELGFQEGILEGLEDAEEVPAPVLPRPQNGTAFKDAKQQ